MKRQSLAHARQRGVFVADINPRYALGEFFGVEIGRVSFWLAVPRWYPSNDKSLASFNYFPTHRRPRKQVYKLN